MKNPKILLILIITCFLTSKEILEEENTLTNISIDTFNVGISEENCTIVRDSLIKLFKEGYIYTDIRKNLPNKDYFGAIDIISELNSIQVTDRKYYDFFRDIKRIFGKTKDGHLFIEALKSPNGYDLQKMAMCLPFSFHIKGENSFDAKIYISEFECIKYYDKNVQDFVEEHKDQYLKEINNTDPFEFIQNFALEFYSIYNNHSTFTQNIRIAHSVNINKNPLSKEQFSNITFVFQDDKNITLDYFLYYDPNLENDKEFIDFYNKELKKNVKTIDEESIINIKNKFYKMKNNLNDNNNNAINWDFSTKDGKIRCRVDYKNNLNVFVQNTFLYIKEDYINALEVVENCTELFYSNNNSIVGIESYNGGGTSKLSYYFQELLQVKVLPTSHFSTLKTKLMKEYVEANISDITDDPDMFQRIDIETCEPFKSFDDMKEIEDNYGEGVKHKRTQYFRIFNSSDLKKHKERREKYFKLDKLKRPTDIIIFTDTYSYSATSFFIKGLQETGSAITVGYFGNPKSNEIMDSSLSPSFIGSFSNTDVYKNIEKAGYKIRLITIYESYNYTYQIKNPIPKEFLIYPVDEKFELFEAYNDNLYEKFMEKAKEVFKKYNEDKRCNRDNLELLYDPNNKKDCYVFEKDEHAHGGYLCDVRTNTWSNICKPYYCDIGYYFDKYQNKCIKDICTEGKDVDPEPTGEGQFMILNQLKTILYILIILG